MNYVWYMQILYRFIASKHELLYVVLLIQRSLLQSKGDAMSYHIVILLLLSLLFFRLNLAYTILWNAFQPSFFLLKL